jgi:hypothetical protein
MIALFMIPVALQAAAVPKSFFSDFPIGRAWIVTEGGLYNEHLIRDVGGLFIALIIVTVWSIWRRDAAKPVAVAWLVQGLFHFGYHLRHLDGYESTDKVAMALSLAAIPILAAVVLVADHKSNVTEPSTV